MLNLGSTELLLILAILATDLDVQAGRVMGQLFKRAGIGRTYQQTKQPDEQHLGCISAQKAAVAEHGRAGGAKNRSQGRSRPTLPV